MGWGHFPIPDGRGNPPCSFDLCVRARRWRKGVMQVSGKNIFREKTQPVQRTWARSLLTTFEVREATVATTNGMRIKTGSVDTG